MSTHKHIRLGTDLVTFFELGHWGIEKSTSYEEWVGIVEADPRHYFDRMLDECVEAGVEGVEFAPPPGGWTTALSAYGSTEGVAQALRSRGLVVSSSFAFGAPLILGAIHEPGTRAAADDEVKRHAEFVAGLGGDLIVMGSVPRAELTGGDVNGTVSADDLARVAEQFDLLGAAAATSGVRIALHTDAYSVCSQAGSLATILEATAPENVKLCLDAGHVTLDGSDAVEILRAHVDRVPIMHWKDCIGPLDGATLTGPIMERHAVMLTYFRVLGTGSVDWAEWQRILRDVDWSGWAVAEIDMSPDPVGEIRAGLRYFDDQLAPIYS